MERDKTQYSTMGLPALAIFRGLYNRVAVKLGVDPSYVSRVARGERKSAAILAALEAEMVVIREHLNNHLDGRSRSDGKSSDGQVTNGRFTDRQLTDGHFADGRFTDGHVRGDGAGNHDGQLPPNGSANRDGHVSRQGAAKSDGRLPRDGNGAMRGKKAPSKRSNAGPVAD